MAGSKTKQQQQKATSNRSQRRERSKEDEGVNVDIPNPLLFNAFGDPFLLRNLSIDDQLVADIANGVVTLLEAGEEPEDGDDSDETVSRNDARIKPLIHATLAFAVEHFLRSRDTKSQQQPNLVIDTQSDSDHVWDIGERLQAAEDKDVLSLSKSDHRWLFQKAKDLAHKAFPLDARMFIDHLEIKGPDDQGDDKE